GCCCGCYVCCSAGCYGCYGGSYAAAPVVVVPATVAPPATPPAEKKKDKEVAVRRDGPPAPARVTITIPEGSRLLVNDVPVQVTPAARTFETPPLEPGREYHYVLTADVMRDGRMVRDVQTIDVAAGRQV